MMSKMISLALLSPDRCQLYLAYQLECLSRSSCHRSPCTRRYTAARTRGFEQHLDREEELGSLLGIYAASVSASNTTSAAIAAAYPAQAQPTSAEVPFSSASKWSVLTLADTQ
jgi:hypothetical protein